MCVMRPSTLFPEKCEGMFASTVDECNGDFSSIDGDRKADSATSTVLMSC